MAARPGSGKPATKTKRGPSPRRVALDDDAWRTSNIGRMLNEAVERFETGVLERMAIAGHQECTLSHIRLTRNLDLQGTRAVELARRASMTKQSLGELVAQLETLGIVKREPDPTDGRARIVLFTVKGRRWLAQFHAALEQTEAEMRSEMGSALYEALKSGLAKYAKRSG